jgi:hypothetical protein
MLLAFNDLLWINESLPTLGSSLQVPLTRAALTLPKGGIFSGN